jgi:Protein of unknown function (DUF541).
LKVSGESIVYEIPEEMTINIPLEIKDSSYSRCTELLINRYNMLVNNFKQVEIRKDEIKIDEMNVGENISWESGRREAAGYAGKLSLQLTKNYDNQTLNKIIKVLNDSDLKNSYSIGFQLSDSQKKILLEKSIENAILDAKTKAKIIAKSMGIELVNILEINFGYVNQTDVLTIGTDELISVPDIRGDSTERTLDLNPQKMEIEKSISIIWDIKQ